jgi:histidinol-phosphatase (PHP family)
MIVDMHNHTTLCKHASGSVEEFVLKAIKNGTKYFGFSDHAPMNFDENYRMSFGEVKFYEKTILHAKSKFQENIEILLGYEVDFLDNLVDETMINRKVDYFIGSVHFLNSWGFDNPEFIGEYKNKDIDKIWEEYFEAIEKMAKSGLFDIVGHIDLMKVFKFLPKKDIRILAKNAIKQIKKANMTIELNSAGLRKPIGEIYPSQEILELIKDHDITITFGSDAHKPEDVGFGSEKVLEIAKKFEFDEVAIFKQRERIMIKI